MTRLVQPVCIRYTEGNGNDIVGMNGTTIGFGINKNEKPSDILLEATLTVVDVYTCLASDIVSYARTLKRNMYCAGVTSGVSPCKGDSGSGMFILKNGLWHLRGIVSFTALLPDGSCDSSKYTVFTDVTKYRDWVLQHIDLCKNDRSSKDAICNIGNRYDHDFLIVSGSFSFFRIPLDGGEVVTINKDARGLERLENILDVDCVTGRFYSVYEYGIFCFDNYNLTDSKHVTNGTSANSAIHSVTVDWISRHLYWTENDRISVASIENPNVRTVLIKNLRNPTTIAVDPNRGKLYWIDYNTDAKRHHIEWSNLDGSDRQSLLHIYLLYQTSKIHVLKATGELCWTDGRSRKIKCIDTNSKQIRTMRLIDSMGPIGLFATDEMLYWVDPFA
ncbi:hypothetical protein ZHAS_00021322 [Anopheles sinensis]|uniref:Peptidase S1 domain-containing protein n=1 Tax=Anopheles sinensis TaxID=74873 RepID=A0A084WS31_ANOSI|nr:hypothetical protein ZHAS_00021322 [Anopheles sinensis]